MQTRGRSEPRLQCIAKILPLCSSAKNRGYARLIVNFVLDKPGFMSGFAVKAVIRMWIVLRF